MDALSLTPLSVLSALTSNIEGIKKSLYHIIKEDRVKTQCTVKTKHYVYEVFS